MKQSALHADAFSVAGAFAVVLRTCAVEAGGHETTGLPYGNTCLKCERDNDAKHACRTLFAAGYENAI